MISSDWLEAVDFSMRSCSIFGRRLYCQHFVKSQFKDKDKGKAFVEDNFLVLLKTFSQ